VETTRDSIGAIAVGDMGKMSSKRDFGLLNRNNAIVLKHMNVDIGDEEFARDVADMLARSMALKDKYRDNGLLDVVFCSARR